MCFFIKVSDSYDSILFFVLVSCGPSAVQKQEKEQKVETSYTTQLNRYRQQKDIMFGSDENSPFYSIKDSIKFTHLSYFEPDEKFKVLASISKPNKKISIVLIDTKGGKREMTVDAILEFTLEGKNYKLNGYGSSDDPGSIFIPFKDLTNNKTTYGGGRYLELSFKNQTSIILDFNLSYNPYCHYNHSYSCPIVPEENSLHCEINAGEKTFGEFIH